MKAQNSQEAESPKLFNLLGCCYEGLADVRVSKCLLESWLFSHVRNVPVWVLRVGQTVRAAQRPANGFPQVSEVHSWAADKGWEPACVMGMPADCRQEAREMRMVLKAHGKHTGHQLFFSCITCIHIYIYICIISSYPLLF